MIWSIVDIFNSVKTSVINYGDFLPTAWGPGSVPENNSIINLWWEGNGKSCFIISQNRAERLLTYLWSHYNLDRRRRTTTTRRRMTTRSWSFEAHILRSSRVPSNRALPGFCSSGIGHRNSGKMSKAELLRATRGQWVEHCSTRREEGNYLQYMPCETQSTVWLTGTHMQSKTGVSTKLCMYCSNIHEIFAYLPKIIRQIFSW